MNKAKCFFILSLLISLGISSPVFAESEFQPEAPGVQTERPNRTPDAEFGEPEVKVDIKEETKEVVKPAENPTDTKQAPVYSNTVRKDESTEEVEKIEETKEEVVEETEETENTDEEEIIEVPEMGDVKNAARKTYREIVIKTLAIAATAMVLVVALFVHEIRVLKNRKPRQAKIDDIEVSAAAVKFAMGQEAKKAEKETAEIIEEKRSVKASDLHKPLI